MSYRHPDAVARFRERLTTLRKERGWSQTELARRSKVTQPTISRIESGAHTDASYATVEALAQALGVATTELLATMNGTADAVTAAGPVLSEKQAAPASTPQATMANNGGPEIGCTDVAELLRDYLTSEWCAIDAPTHEELRWFASQRMITWVGAPPTAATAHAILAQRRKGKL